MGMMGQEYKNKRRMRRSSLSSSSYNSPKKNETGISNLPRVSFPSSIPNFSNEEFSGALSLFLKDKGLKKVEGGDENVSRVQGSTAQNANRNNNNNLDHFADNSNHSQSYPPFNAQSPKKNASRLRNVNPIQLPGPEPLPNESEQRRRANTNDDNRQMRGSGHAIMGPPLSAFQPPMNR
eukprot:TRINITY_DN4590_c4_g1_i1.p1 TRINITY_DN4590_c4_g1~~TRINITY_DN4590_c4_g1_i1.p1  ORF type:complete len:179 (-),score=68.63 TRINITY_DN4590_c4_g1_i1:53-589(-)